MPDENKNETETLPKMRTIKKALRTSKIDQRRYDRHLQKIEDVLKKK
jgi:hypothetical protein